MRNISIKWRMTLWFSLLMIAITALMLVFVMLMNRNTVTRPPEAELLYMVGRNADDVEFDHGDWDFSDVEQYAHGVYTEIFDEDGQRLFGTAHSYYSTEGSSQCIRAMLLLGKCYDAKNMHDMALRQLEEANKELIEMNDTKKEILYMIGLLYEKLGKKEESLAAFQQIYDAEYGYRDVAKRVESSYSN